MCGVLTGVRSHVDDQLTGLDEGLVTDVALVWPFASVDAHVAVQLAAVLKGTAAYVTLVGALLGVDPPVHLQILLNAKHFMAELALERPFSGVRSIVTDLEEEGESRFIKCILS